MEVTLNTPSVKDLSAVAASLNTPVPGFVEQPKEVLDGVGVRVTSASPDLEALLAELLMETNEARVNAARERLASALGQLENVSEDQKEKIALIHDASEKLEAVEDRLDADSERLDEASDALDEAKDMLEDAQDALEDAKEDAISAKADYDEAVAELEEYRNSGGEIDPDDLADLEEEVAEAKRELDEANAKVASATGDVASAEKAVSSAKSAFDAAQASFAASESAYADLETEIDELVDSIDPATVAALREKLGLNAGDLDHLHREIEEDDNKHHHAVVRSVEDVIGDSLKRLDGKIIDEIEERHLDHV